jgi:photosystem II stability/assembly factor-like uncharacterized protein
MKTFLLPSFRLLTVALVSIGLLATAYSANAAGWYQQTSNSTANLSDINGNNSFDLIAVGASGEVLYTTDRGETWATASTSATTENLNAVAAASNSVAVAVGNNGTIITSADQGDTWTLRSSGTTEDLYGVEMYSSTKGYALGANGTILYTSNGGSSWSAKTSGTTETLLDASFVSSSVAWVVGAGGTILKTTDTGSTWTAQTSGVTNTLHAVDFLAASVGRVVGSQKTVLVTVDSGATWSSESVDALTMIDSIKDLAYIDTNNVDLVGAFIGDSHLVYTQDNGTSWSHSTFEIEADPLTGIFVYSSSVRLSVGGSGQIFAYDGNGPNAVTDLALDGTSPTEDNTPTFTWTAATDDETSVSTYYVQLDSFGATDVGDVATYTFSTVDDGDHTVTVYAVDAFGNEGDSESVEFTVDTSGSSSADTTLPTVGAVTPTTVTTGASTEFSATYSDNVAVTACTMYVEGTSFGAMTLSSGTASISFSLPVAGTETLGVKCVDAAGNIGEGTETSVTVTDEGEDEEAGGATTSEEEDTAVGSAAVGSLIKRPCGVSSDATDGCRAVYYYADDGKRHAFPNEKVFFTWFDDFQDVIIVSPDFLASLTLGSNVTYHPGTKMVKFQTVHTVYAVERYGVLRAIASEEVATDLYGDDWNQQIDDISDAFFGNYEFGDNIDEAADYDVQEAVDSVGDLNDNF